MTRLNKTVNFLFIAGLLLGTAASAGAQTATLAWDKNTEPDVTGYTLSYGTSPGAYTQHINVGNVTQYTVSGLDLSLNYYFSVQAYNASGLVSAFSNEAMMPAPVPPGTTTITGFSANTAYPLQAGNTVTWTAAATSLRGQVQYKFFLYSPSAGYVVVQDWSSVPTYTWTPSWADIGSHAIQVWARTVGSVAPYEAWVAANFAVNGKPVEITASVDFPTPSGNPVQLTAAAAGLAAGSTPEYRFYVLNQGTNTWSLLRDYATSNQATWTPSANGNYIVQVWARAVGSTNNYDVWGSTSQMTVSASPLQVQSLNANVSFPVKTGTPITWTARVKGGTKGPIQYEFFRYTAAGGWVLVQPWSTTYTYSWTPAWGDEGQAAIQVWVRNSGSTATYDAWLGTGLFQIDKASVQLTVGSRFPVPPGTSVALSAQVADTSATFEYQYYLYTQATGTWSVLRAYGTTPNVTWVPNANGTYAIQVYARKVGSTVAYDSWAGTGYVTVSQGPASIDSLTPNVALPSQSGTPITWTAAGIGGTASPLQYKFFIYSDATGWALLRDYATSNTVTWTPPAAGAYVMQVWVRSAGSTSASYEGWLSTGYFVIRP